MLRALALYIGIFLPFATAVAANDISSQQPDSNGVYVPGLGVTGPALVHGAPAQCPADSEHLKRVVALSLIVNANGAVEDVKTFNASRSPLDEAAIPAVGQSTFSPGTKDGVAVKVRRDIWVSF